MRGYHSQQIHHHGAGEAEDVTPPCARGVLGLDSGDDDDGGGGSDTNTVHQKKAVSNKQKSIDEDVSEKS